MRVFFDPNFDSAVWPGPLAGRDAVAGEVWAGPAYLLDLLETALGLGGPPQSQALRAASIVPAVRSVEGFWSQSATLDPFQAALRLLRWRDALWNAGWRGEPVSARLAQLATVTRGIVPGPPDRLVTVAETLASRSADVDIVEILEPDDDVPPVWRTVFDALAARGTRIERRTLAPAAAVGDLHAARASGFVPAGDGSLQLIRPTGPLQAAEEVAAWLATLGSLEDTVVIGADPVLDAALHRHGLPATGTPLELRDNALVQILPLVIAMAWAPPDPRRALELLSLPASPVPQAVARRLARALHESPAVDSDDWRQALAKGLDEIATRNGRDYRRAVEERLRGIFTAAVPRSGTYPAAEVRRRLDLLDRWLRGRLEREAAANASLGDTSTLAVHHAAQTRLAWETAATQSAALRRLVDETGLDALSAPQLQRLVDQAMEHGLTAGAFPAQAGLPSVRTPGAVAGPARRIVWWSFDRDAATFPPSMPLSTLEVTALARLGIAVPDPGRLAIAAAERWRRPLAQAREALLLVAPVHDARGAEQHPHPLWDEIEANATGAASVTALVRATPLAPVPPRVRVRDVRPLPQPRRRWHTAGAIPARACESPSGLGTLLGCSYAWTLRYAGRLRGGATAAIPAAEQMLGNVTHALLALVLEKGSTVPEDAEAEAARLFDAEAPRMAAPLFLPGADAALAEARQVVRLATRELFRHLHAAGLEVVAVETTYARPCAAGPLEGRPDLVVGVRRGSKPEVRGVIDLKWSGATYRRDELAGGTAYQLAAYSHLVRTADHDPLPPVAFYILRDQRLLVADTRVFRTGEPVGEVTSHAMWTAVERAVTARRAELERGLLDAPGNAGDGEDACGASSLVDETLIIEPPCRFCDLSLLCGRAFAAEATAGADR